MTATEKITKIEALLKVPMRTYMEADEIEALREGLKISDFFRWLKEAKQESRTSPEHLYKILGGCTVTPDGRWHEGLEKAIRDGYVKSYSVKKYGRYINYIELTKKGEKLVFPAK